MGATTVIYKDDPQNEVFKLLVQGPNVKKRVFAKYGGSPHHVLPGLYAGDPKYQDFLRDACDALNDQIEHNPVNFFASSSGVNSSFDKMRTVAGVMGTPAGHVLYDNTLKREKELKVRNDLPTKFELDILYELIDAMVEFADYRDLKVAAKSSQGLIKGSFDKEEKIRDAMKLLEKENFNDFLSCLERKDGMAILQKHGTVFAYLQGLRGSPDSKQRKTPDLQYAISGGREGSLVDVDRRIIGSNGRPVDGLYAFRPRLVLGMHNPINIAISTWRAGTANYYLNRFSYTWKHTGKEQICEKLNAFKRVFKNGVIRGVDVAQYDASVMKWIREKTYNYCKERHYSTRFGDMVLQAAFAPVLQPDVGDGVGPVFHGNPIKLETLESPGLLSGFDLVSFEGKLFNVWQAMVLIARIKGEEYIKGHVKEFLEGKLDIRMLNAGDDGLIMFPDLETCNKFFSREVMQHSFLAIEAEKSLQFIGFVFEELSDGTIIAHNNVNSFVTGTLCPEKPYNSKLRQYWHVGLREKFIVYGSHPSFDKVLDVLNWSMKTHLPQFVDFTTLCNRLISSNAHLVPDLRSEADRLYIMDPNSIHYKLDQSEVSPELLADDYANIPRSHYEWMIGEHLFSRQIM